MRTTIAQAMLVAALLTGATGGTPGSMARTGAQAGAETRSYIDRVGGISLRYPTTWTGTPGHPNGDRLAVLAPAFALFAAPDYGVGLVAMVGDGRPGTATVRARGRWLFGAGGTPAGPVARGRARLGGRAFDTWSGRVRRASGIAAIAVYAARVGARACYLENIVYGRSAAERAALRGVLASVRLR